MERPNIIYILGDDHRADYLGVSGHQVLETPNLDWLAENGTYFPNAFCTSPACTPSRACHYTGQWERRHGINFNSKSSMAPPAWEASFPMLLKRQGYFLGWVGKNHVPAGPGGYTGGYFEEVFDYWYGNHGHSGFYPKEHGAGGRIYTNAEADTQIEVFEEGVMNFLRPDQAFLNGCSPSLPARPEERPFCLCVTFNLPHGASTGTMQLRPTDDAMYTSAYRDRQHLLHPPATYMNADEAAKNPRVPRWVYCGRYIPQYDYVKTPYYLRERQVRTCQTVAGMDRMLGRLLEMLDRMDLLDNTIIVFSTDHGLHHGEHGLGGKCFLYEEDLRIPMFIYDPRLSEAGRGRHHREMAVVPDLAPTMMELAGLDVPDTMQGRSLVPLMRGEQCRWRDEFFCEQLLDWQNYPRSEALRSEEWKYIRYFKRNTDYKFMTGGGTYGTKDEYGKTLSSTLTGEQPVFEELYHLSEDPGETRNVADVPEFRHVLDRFRGRIVELGREAKGDIDKPPMTLPL